MIFENDQIDVLAVDNRQDILELSKLVLENVEDDISVDTTVNPEEGLEWLEEGFYDAVLSDYNMPVMDGIEFLEEVRNIDEDLPFILYTGKGSEEVAADAVGHDVTDYFRKEAGTEHYELIASRIVDAVESYRKDQEMEIFESIVEHSDNPVVVTDADSSILYVNEAFEEVTGYSLDEIRGENPSILNSREHGAETFAEMYDALEDGEVFEIENMTNVDKSGDAYRHDQRLIPVHRNGEEPEFYAAVSTVKEE